MKGWRLIMNEVNLYIHIPFCKKKCFYCDFISYPNKDDYIEEYIDTVIKEYCKTFERNKFRKGR